jgi:hypothetical protein
VLVERADPIDQLPVQVVPTIDLNRYHSHMLLERQVGYPAGPMAKLPAEAVPMDQAKRVRPIVAFPQYLLHLAHSTQQAVAELGFECPTLRPVVVEQGFVHPIGKVVVERVSGNSMQRVAAGLGFECPTLRPVVVEQAFAPSQVFVVAELGFEYPTLRPVVVEQGFVDPILLVVAEHPMYWVVDLVGSKDLRLVYFPVDSIQVVEPVVPDVANPKKPQHSLSSSFHYERVVALRPGLWLLLPERHPL